MDLILSPWLIWFLAGIVVMLAELAVPGFIIFFFGLGCWGGAVAALFAPQAYSAQVAVFLIVSIASIVFLRKMAMRIFVGTSEGPEDNELQSNVPAGTRIILDHPLEAGRVGRVRFRGTLWDAVSDESLPAGSEAEILGVDKANRSCLKLKAVPR